MLFLLVLSFVVDTIVVVDIGIAVTVAVIGIVVTVVVTVVIVIVVIVFTVVDAVHVGFICNGGIPINHVDEDIAPASPAVIVSSPGTLRSVARKEIEQACLFTSTFLTPRHPEQSLFCVALTIDERMVCWPPVNQ